jgi:hypothetical protein
MTVLDSLVEDAMQDGAISAEERTLIMNQARRRLNAQEIDQIEARLSALPNAAAMITKESMNAGESQAVTTPAPFVPADNEQTCCDEPGCGGWFENTYIFGAADGFKGPIDDVNNNNFGLRIGFNSGVPLWRECGIGLQFGASYGAYDFQGRDRRQSREACSLEEHVFLTAGLFKRCDLCAPCDRLCDRISWGVVYDHLIVDNLGEDGWEVGLGQVRAQIGYALNHADEVGIMGSLHTNADKVDGRSNDQDPVSALDQGSLFYHHKWCWGADTMAYIGIAEDPGEFVFGARGEVPISRCCSLFGNAQYILPSAGCGSEPGTSRDQFAEEFWNVSVGVVFYPCGNAVSKSVCRQRWMPLLPVADNGTFVIDVSPDDI